jgi:hypothetical protein
MPKRLFENRAIVQCVNRDLPDHRQAAPGQASTMVTLASFHAVTSVTTPQDPGGVTFNPGAGIPVRCYICRVCGYVEMYAATFSEPNIWGQRGQ